MYVPVNTPFAVDAHFEAVYLYRLQNSHAHNARYCLAREKSGLVYSRLYLKKLTYSYFFFLQNKLIFVLCIVYD